MIRAAREGEAGALTALMLRSKQHWGYDDEFMKRVSSELIVREETVASGNVHVLVRDDGTVVGFYALKKLRENEGELDMLFVEPVFIGEGAGNELLVHALGQSRGQGWSSLFVESDPFAEAFYLHTGAVRSGESISPSTGRALPYLRYTL